MFRVQELVRGFFGSYEGAFVGLHKDFSFSQQGSVL